MKKKTLLIAVVAIALAVVTAASVTVAWLTAESNQVVNTFTYGNIQIKLTESNKTNETGLSFTDVVPGDVKDKDPIVTVESGSEDCYVYVLIKNELGTAVTLDITADWISIETKGDYTLYRFKTGADAIVSAKSQAVDCAVFNHVTFKGELKNADIDALAGKQIVIKAFAHQAKNTDEATADAAAKTWMSTITG